MAKLVMHDYNQKHNIANQFVQDSLLLFINEGFRVRVG